jgi:hypothetical protein
MYVNSTILTRDVNNFGPLKLYTIKIVLAR